jgi:hypothetical protein
MVIAPALLVVIALVAAVRTLPLSIPASGPSRPPVSAPSTEEPAAPAAGVILSSGIVSLGGNVVLIDDEGREHHGETGSIDLQLSGRRRRVEVQDGAWSTQVAQGVGLSIRRGILRDRPVRIDGYQGPAMNALRVTARWIPPPLLYVVGEDKGLELEDVEVVEVLEHDSPWLMYPSSDRVRPVLARSAASPLDLEQLLGDEASSPGHRSLFVRSPGFAWARVTAPRYGEEHTLSLKRAGRLEVTLNGRAPEYPAVLQLREQGRMPKAFYRAQVEADTFELDALLPGEYLASVEVGPKRRPAVLGQAPVRITVGNATELNLELTAPPTNTPMPVSGTVLLPPGVPQAMELHLYRGEVRPGSRVPSARLTQDRGTTVDTGTLFSFSLPEVAPGECTAHLVPLGFVQRVVIPPTGTDALHIEVPPETVPAAFVGICSVEGPASRTSSLILTEGVTGGISAAPRHRRVAFSYDWNRGAYRVVEYRAGDGVYVCDLPRSDFERILDEVAARGLMDLPLEEPRASEDIYHLNTSVYSGRDGRSWENRAPGGCVHRESLVQPAPEQVEAFQSVVLFLEGTLAGLSLRPGTVFDECVAQFQSEDQQRAFPMAVEWLRHDPLFEQLDLNRFRAEGTSFWFAFRGKRHAAHRRLRDWPGYIQVAVSLPQERVTTVGRWLPDFFTMGNPGDVDQQRLVR